MKIIFLSGDFPPQSFGGAGISTYKLALAMNQAGHDVYAITTCREKSQAGFVEYNGIKVYKIATDYHPRWRAYLSLYNPPVVKEVERIFKEIRPDIVHANNVHFYLSYHCLKLAKKYARAVVWTARDVMAFNYGKLRSKKYLETLDYRTNWIDHIRQGRKRWNLFRNIIIKKYLKYADKLLAVSHALQTALAQNGINGVEVIHTGTDVKSWETTLAEREQFREKHNLKDKKVILFGGRLHPSKGGDKLIQAMVDVVKAVPNAVILVAGKTDEHSDHMKTEATKLGVGDRLIFTGWLEEADMKYAYAGSDIVVVPSVCFDSFPRIVLEAMAAGRPVIGTCYGGAPEIIEEGVSGYVVNPHHIKEMADKVIDILSNPEKSKKFGEAAKERVRENFDTEAKTAELIAVYGSLLNK